MKTRPKVTCKICNRSYNTYPALSRYDNKTDICTECGQVEAFNTQRILICRKAKLPFEDYARIMVKGYDKPIVKQILALTKRAMRAYKGKLKP